MTLRLYDTATREVRDFVPLVEGQAGIYHCGLTVQGAPHIGHIRKEVVFDVLRRWMERSGYQVTVVANVTDIDDKILVKAEEAGVPGGRWPTPTSARCTPPTTSSAARRRPTSRGRPATCRRWSS